ncbi:MAG: hypothetical protein WC719_03110 [Patescibacteria group bacterium]|jgi:hypothetical protein
MAESLEFRHLEARKGKTAAAESLADTELNLDKLNEHLKSELNYLEASIWRLKDMETHNKFVNEMNSDLEMSIDEKDEKYSPKETSEMDQEIERTWKHIEETKDYIAEYTVLKEKSRDLIDKFDSLESDLKNFLITVRPDQRQ